MHDQVIYYRLHDLKKILENKNINRIFLVTGNKSFDKSDAKNKLDLLLQNFDVLRYPVLRPNPLFDDILEGAEKIRDFHPEVIIAIGGGSVQDTAKLLSVISLETNKANELIMGKICSPKREITFISIPTTAGSGSEATHFAVVYKDGIKYSVASEHLLPDFVVLDPTLTYTLTPYLTAVSGMDALSQAIESYWAVGSTNESKVFATDALRLILSVFPEIVKNATPESRRKMLMGAHLAGKAINISKTTAPHAISYVISSFFKVAHGQAVALTLPLFFEHNLGDSGTLNHGINKKDISKIKTDLCRLLNCKDVAEGKRKITQIIKDCNLKTKITEFVSSDKRVLNLIMNGINKERLMNNPKILSSYELKTLLRSIA
ncbi:MAG TPA: phosphonoacetaldehyde reductase [Ignavibacteriaceae bacterium]|nr:phosphonoacetaldehyde reductase [Ignavibacteriaceae bacterium]